MNKSIHQNMSHKTMLKEDGKEPSIPSVQPPPPNKPSVPKGVTKTKHKATPKKGSHHE